MRSPLVPILLSGLVVAGARAQATLHVLTGNQTGAEYGAAVAVIGDVDGDGKADLAVGAPLDDTGANDAGVVWIVSGATGSVLHTITGTVANGHLGAALAGAGDVDGDGHADVAIGSPGTSTGSVMVVSGATGAVLTTVTGGVAGAEFGAAVAGGRDLDGDGYDDFVVGSPGADSNGIDSGSARAFSGRTLTPLWTVPGASAGDAFGSSVGVTTDADGDGLPDVAVGAIGDDDGGAEAGSVRLVKGTTGAQIWIRFGAAAGDALGSAVAGCGDCDGDGKGDVVAGAPMADTAGADAGLAMLLSGLDGSTLWSWAGEAANDHLGAAVAGLGDANGDGLGDVLIGAPGSDRGGMDSGRVRAQSGASGTVLFDLFGAAGDRLGTGVGGAGNDVDHDGFGDAIVGAPGDDTAAPDGGAARVLAPRPYDTHSLAIELTPGAAAAHAGYEVVGLDDIDGDGVPEYAVGAPFDNGNFGAVYVYSGATNALFRTYNGQRIDTWFGHSIASAGDVNADGVPDLLVGAWHDDTATLMDCGTVTVFSGKDGSILNVLYGNQNLSHMGSSIGSLGDLDGDGYDDFFTGLGLTNNEGGALWVWSGKTYTVMYPLRGVPGLKEAFAWSAAPSEDLDGDGYRDLIVGVPQYTFPLMNGNGAVRVYSGKTGAFLFEHNGIQAQSLFGWSVASAGDVDGDGIPDIVAGGYRYDNGSVLDAGQVRVISGKDGSLLYEMLGTTPSEDFGLKVAGGLDADGDGFGDIVIGAPGATPAGGQILAGQALLVSGHDANVLETFDGDATLDNGGWGVGMVGDLNGDGLAEVIVGNKNAAPNGMNSGLARLYKSSRKTLPGAFYHYGAGCPTAGNRLPHVTLDGRPVRGLQVSLGVRAGKPSTPAAMMLGAMPANTPLAGAGAPGCFSLVSPLVVLPKMLDASGAAKLTFVTPDNPTVPGVTLYTQWLVVDPGVNTLNVVTSDGGEIVFGKP